MRGHDRDRLVTPLIAPFDQAVAATFDDTVAPARRAAPETFSVPRRYAKHVMIVAELEAGNTDAIEDPIIGAWELQSGK
jgi:hypothetical protein